jgi:hypothetical protein
LVLLETRESYLQIRVRSLTFNCRTKTQPAGTVGVRGLQLFQRNRVCRLRLIAQGQAPCGVCAAATRQFAGSDAPASAPNNESAAATAIAAAKLALKLVGELAAPLADNTATSNAIPNMPPIHCMLKTPDALPILDTMMQFLENKLLQLVRGLTFLRVNPGLRYQNLGINSCLL